jgi:hypothetical protein
MAPISFDSKLRIKLKMKMPFTELLKRKDPKGNYVKVRMYKLRLDVVKILGDNFRRRKK